MSCKSTVLCVERRTEILDEVTASLADAGYDVVRTASAELAKRALQEQHVDAVLIQASLPNVNVTRFRQQVRESAGEIPVLVFHGSGEVLRAQLRVLDAWVHESHLEPAPDLFSLAVAEYVAKGYGAS